MTKRLTASAKKVSKFNRKVTETDAPTPPPPCNRSPHGALTWCSLPEGLHALLAEDLPGGVEHARVRGLSGPGRHLGPRQRYRQGVKVESDGRCACNYWFPLGGRDLEMLQGPAKLVRGADYLGL